MNAHSRIDPCISVYRRSLGDQFGLHSIQPCCRFVLELEGDVRISWWSFVLRQSVRRVHALGLLDRGQAVRRKAALRFVEKVAWRGLPGRRGGYPSSRDVLRRLGVGVRLARSSPPGHAEVMDFDVNGG